MLTINPLISSSETLRLSATNIGGATEYV